MCRTVYLCVAFETYQGGTWEPRFHVLFHQACPVAVSQIGIARKSCNVQCATVPTVTVT